MKEFLVIIAISASYLFFACSATASVEPQYVLVMARTGKVVDLGDVQPATAGGVPFGVHVRVELMGIRVVSGTFAKERVSVETTASHVEMLKNRSKIYMFIEVRGDELKVLYWDVPYVVACVPETLANKLSSLDFYPEMIEPQLGRKEPRRCFEAGPP